MKAFLVKKGFLHYSKYYVKGAKVDFGRDINTDLEARGLIKWVDRPEIIMPNIVEGEKKKKYVRKSKK